MGPPVSTAISTGGNGTVTPTLVDGAAPKRASEQLPGGKLSAADNAVVVGGSVGLVVLVLVISGLNAWDFWLRYRRRGLGERDLVGKG